MVGGGDADAGDDGDDGLVVPLSADETGRGIAEVETDRCWRLLDAETWVDEEMGTEEDRNCTWRGAARGNTVTDEAGASEGGDVAEETSAHDGEDCSAGDSGSEEDVDGSTADVAGTERDGDGGDDAIASPQA